MEKERDEAIVALYYARDERALEETKKHFSSYCRKIAYGLLRSEEDARECENDVYLAAWNSIPPNRPEDLATYLGKLTRRAAIDRVRRENRLKRAGLVEALDEFAETLPSPEGVEDAIEAKELSRLLSEFLHALSDIDRAIFLRRYWFGDDLSAVARRFGLRKSALKMRLLRLRGNLREYLTEKGIDL